MTTKSTYNYADANGILNNRLTTIYDNKDNYNNARSNFKRLLIELNFDLHKKNCDRRNSPRASCKKCYRYARDYDWANPNDKDFEILFKKYTPKNKRIPTIDREAWLKKLLLNRFETDRSRVLELMIKNIEYIKTDTKWELHYFNYYEIDAHEFLRGPVNRHSPIKKSEYEYDRDWMLKVEWTKEDKEYDYWNEQDWTIEVDD